MPLLKIDDSKVGEELGEKFVPVENILSEKLDGYAPKGANAYKIIFPRGCKIKIEEYRGSLLVVFYKINDAF